MTPHFETKITYGSTSSHGTQQTAVDLNDLLDCLTGDPVTGCCSRIGGDDDAALEAEGESGCSVSDLDGAIGVAVVVCHRAEPVLS